MTYQQFKENILQTLQREFGSDVKVIIQNITKNNSTQLDGLTVLSPQYNISPTIYLDFYYKKYQNGTSISDICQEILNTYHENQPKTNIDISFFTSYDKVKSKIIFKLINYEKNKQLLTQIPHYRFLDLAIVFNCLLDSSPMGNATILIYNHHLDFWNITSDDLYALAVCNTPKLMVYDLRNMTDILKELLSGTEFPPCNIPDQSDFPMYVLSNKYRLNGSVCILYHDLLKDFAKRVNSDLYILPSSIHEVLIIPASKADSCQEYTDMVREVNATQLSREEILSDHVYYFSKDTCQITM